MITIERFKEDAEFFPSGRIIPQRILKGPRWMKAAVTFGGNAWARGTPHGYVILVESADGCMLRISRTSRDRRTTGYFRATYRPRRSADIRLRASPYYPAPSGTHFVAAFGDKQATERALVAALAVQEVGRG